MEFDVFISYSSRDKTVTDAICAHLEQRKIRCWYADRDIPPGDDWAGSIMKAIDTAKIFVLVFTDYSNASNQVLREVNAAVSRGIPIIPFKLTPNEPTGGMRYYLGTVHWLDAMNEELEVSIGHLCDMCQSLMETGLEYSIPKQKPDKPVSKPKEDEKEPTFWDKYKKYIIVAICVLAVLCAGFAGLRNKTVNEPQETVYEIVTTVSETLNLSEITEIGQGNTISNLKNGSYCASDGEYLFYRSNDNMTLYKTKPDGSEKTKLSSEAVGFVAVVDEYVYYTGSDAEKSMCRMLKDGSGSETLYKGFFSDIFIAEGRIYFKNSYDGLHLYSMTLEGLDQKCVNRKTNIGDYVILNGNLYYTDSKDGHKLFRSELNGDNAELLKDSSITGLTASGKYLFYNDKKHTGLYALNTSTLAEYEICSRMLENPNVNYGEVFGYISGESYLSKIAEGKHTVSTLTDTEVKGICVCGDKVYFLGKSNSVAYFCDRDGNNVTEA